MISNCAKYFKSPESLRRPIATCMGWRPPSQSCVVSRALTSSSQELLQIFTKFVMKHLMGRYKSISIAGMPCIIKRPFLKFITLQYMYNSFLSTQPLASTDERPTAIYSLIADQSFKIRHSCSRNIASRSVPPFHSLLPPF